MPGLQDLALQDRRPAHDIPAPTDGFLLLKSCCICIQPLQSERLGYEISFCEAGGMHIEEHWDKLRTVKFDTDEPLTGERGMGVARQG